MLGVHFFVSKYDISSSNNFKCDISIIKKIIYFMDKKKMYINYGTYVTYKF